MSLMFISITLHKNGSDWKLDFGMFPVKDTSIIDRKKVVFQSLVASTPNGYMLVEKSDGVWMDIERKKGSRKYNFVFRTDDDFETAEKEFLPVVEKTILKKELFHPRIRGKVREGIRRTLYGIEHKDEQEEIDR